MARKLAKQKKKKESPAVEITQSISEYALTMFLIIVCVWIPLYMKEGYYRIGTAKFSAYAHLVIFGLPLVLALVLLYRIFVWREKGFAAQLKKLPAQFMPTDWFVLAFLAAAFLSFAASVSRDEAFWGYEGWFMGLFFQISIVVLYFLASRQGRYGGEVLAVLCAAAFVVFVIGVLHRLLIDPIGTYANISDYYKTQFLSTLGQASWYSSFVCTVLPLGAVCYFMAQKVWLRIVSGIFTFVGFMTLVTQNSDSAYIALAMMLLVLLYFAVEDAGRMQRFLEILLLFFAAPKLMQLLLTLHPNETLDLDRLSHMLVFGASVYFLFVLTAVLWCAALLLQKRGCYPVRAMRILCRGVYIVFAVAVAAAVVILVLSARGKLSGPLLTLSEKVPYLTWNDRWGNGRGFTWAATGKMIAEFPLVRKLIGVGPDCYGPYAYAHYADQMNAMWGNNTLTNAHNEWFNMIVNYGFVGAALYLGIFVSALTAFIRHAERSPRLVACAACVAAYMGHNLFCYQQVLCTPFVFLIMAFGVYELRKTSQMKNEP